MNTLTQRHIRLIGFMVALGVTATLHGAMLWKLDSVAQHHAALQRGEPTPIQVTLERVTIVAPRS